MRSKTAIHTIATLAFVLASTGLAQAQKPQTPVNGQGTAGKVTKWTSATTVGDSNITEDKFGRVGIGVEAPTTRLAVAGVIESVSGGGGVGGGFKFPDGSVQKSAGLGANQIVGSENVIVTPSGNTVVISVQGLLKAGDAVTRVNGVTGDVTFVAGQNITLNQNGNTIEIAASSSGVSAPLVLEAGVANSPILTVKNLGVGDGPSASGILAVGGDTENGLGGQGIVALGGKSFTDRGGAGVIAGGGNSSTPGFAPGVGIVASGGSNQGDGSLGAAGQFQGDIVVFGNIVIDGETSRTIDHPLDPANKLLVHAAIESSEALNVYSGNATTDARGVAVVELPDWFGAVNTDVRYQLTVLGDTFARAVVAEKVANNRFTIRTDEPNVEVSWQVTGVRSDAAAKRAAFTAVKDKPADERGLYRSPEAFGQPAERGTFQSRYGADLKKAGH